MPLPSRPLIPWHLAALLLFIGLKLGFQSTAPEQLLFLLKPVVRLLQFLTGAEAIWKPGTGFFVLEWAIVIDSSCAGISFWALAFAVLHICFAQKGMYPKKSLQALSGALLLGYILTIPANALRIYLSLFLREKVLSMYPDCSLAAIHQGTGIAVQVTLLSLLYLALHRRQTFSRLWAVSGT
ncbi:MAG: exosortase K [Sphingobacteriales bacterium]|nr:MAG: exosortase K [Sphingobacteriales bacterium]